MYKINSLMADNHFLIKLKFYRNLKSIYCVCKIIIAQYIVIKSWNFGEENHQLEISYQNDRNTDKDLLHRQDYLLIRHKKHMSFADIRQVLLQCMS